MASARSTNRILSIVDYGMGNLGSVANAIQFLGYRSEIVSEPEAVARAEAIVLPGVGAFGEAMNRLEGRGLVGPLTDRVMEKGTPFFGICLGMQLLARESTEGGRHAGLGWIEGAVDLIAATPEIRVPHVGWNDVRWPDDEVMFRNVQPNANFFFDHSFALTCDPAIVCATVDYGGPIVAAIHRRNILATQFHPERSQNNGLRVLRNFLNVVDGRA